MPNKITKITTPDNTEYDIVDDKAYHVNDTTDTTINDTDFVPLSTSSSTKKKSTFSNLVEKIKTKIGRLSAQSGGTDLTLVNTGDMYTWNNKAETSDITSAIQALDVANTNVGADKTIKKWSETDGKVSITTQDISITKSQISDFPTIPTKTSDLQNDGEDTTSPFATEAYVTTAIDNLPEPMIFKGTLGTGGTITTLPTASASNEGFTYKVITKATYAGQAAKVGDVFVSNGSSWVLIPSGDTDSDTWRAINVNGNDFLGSAISTGVVNFINGTNTTVVGSGHDIQIDAVDTTYESKAAVSGGTDESLVTTGEKYTWNSKANGSHTHGNIQNNGTLQTNDITIASGDKLIVTDSSNSSKVARTSVEFDGSTTTTALTPKGTFEAFSKLTLGNGSTNAYYGDKGKTAYDHSQLTSGNPHGVTKSDIGLGNVPNVTTDNQTPTVTQATTRANLAAGDTLKTIIGKIKKYFADLKTVAFTGSYGDLSGTPTIPTVNNATLTIQKNGSTVKTFTANASSDVTANITVPTKTSDLTNDSGFVTTDENVTQNATITTNADYSVMLSATATNSKETGHVNKSSDFKYNPSTNILSVSKINATSTQNASGSSENKTALTVGTFGGAHLEIDPNEIMCKSNGTTVTTLYINKDGGNVAINNNTNPIMFSNGTISVTRTSEQTDPDTDLPAQLTLQAKYTPSGGEQKTSSATISAYSDRNGWGSNLVINPRGNLFIGSGEAPANHYALYKNNTSENLYITSDGETNIQAGANSQMSDRKGFKITSAGAIVPNVADTATNNSGSIGTSSCYWANVYSTNVDSASVASGEYIAKSDNGNNLVTLKASDSTTTVTNTFYLPASGSGGTIALTSGLNVVTQTNTPSTDADYRVLLSRNANNTTQNVGTRKCEKLTFNPNSGTLKTDYLIVAPDLDNAMISMSNSNYAKANIKVSTTPTADYDIYLPPVGGMLALASSWTCENSSGHTGTTAFTTNILDTVSEIFLKVQLGEASNKIFIPIHIPVATISATTDSVERWRGGYYQSSTSGGEVSYWIWKRDGYIKMHLDIAYLNGSSVASSTKVYVYYKTY